MTSYMIDAFHSRPHQTAAPLDGVGACTFCRIIAREEPAHIVYENDHVIAILDILPIRPGHTLVIPKPHFPRVSELPEELSMAVGAAVSRVAKAMTEVTGRTGLNIVCNQDYAQVVPHAHYHIVPAPNLSDKPHKRGASFPRQTLLGHEHDSRDELDDDDARKFAKAMRCRL
ncbi:hypothetical protein BOTBODRAFT_39875 [Botryobasidium botryosum FD-172 SS1]|uniref:HIT domain-containing protein n=1 Tax=Botryobasidium botryosum (strain FD-172 SS1) TaxID=930990 RepID=A0A067LRT1_BOTB1|nr:hypothetical protein BOTBODRAFT_39875 [Botryobasidium botryosum FD-172 SS1]